MKRNLEMKKKAFPLEHKNALPPPKNKELSMCIEIGILNKHRKAHTRLIITCGH